MNPPLEEYCQAKLKKLEETFLLRRLKNWEIRDPRIIRYQGHDLVNFSSNDYLGLTGHPRVRQALQKAFESPVGAGASRLITGNHSGYELLEKELARFKQTEAATVFGSGYTAALGSLPALLEEGDFVVMDKLCHACLVDGARLSGATLRVYPHNNMKRCGELISICRSKGGKNAKILLLTESLFSMDGDLAPLDELADIKQKHGVWLMVDEAHATGVLGSHGRGGAEHFGVEREVDISLGTLSKALGCVGGFVCGTHALKQLLINRARSLVYSTALPSALCNAAAAALRVAGSHPALREKLWQNANNFSKRIQQPLRSPIFPIIIGEESRCMEESVRLFNNGFMVPCIRYPTVGRGKARLRISVTAAHTPEDIAQLASLLKPREHGQ